MKRSNRLTEAQKNAIRDYRRSGLGYKAIASRLDLSRETVRSFCVRNDVLVGSSCNGAIPSHDNILMAYLRKFCSIWKYKSSTGRITHTDSPSHESGNASEYKIGGTIFVISTGHSENASETLEKKLEKLILDAASRQYGNCCFVRA